MDSRRTAFLMAELFGGPIAVILLSCVPPVSSWLHRLMKYLLFLCVVSRYHSKILSRVLRAVQRLVTGIAALRIFTIVPIAAEPEQTTFAARAFW